MIKSYYNNQLPPPRWTQLQQLPVANAYLDFKSFPPIYGHHVIGKAAPPPEKPEIVPTPGQEKFEKEADAVQFMRLSDNLFSMTLGGEQFKIQLGPRGETVYFVDQDGREVRVRDRETRVRVYDKFYDLKNKQWWCDQMNETPLDEVQRNAFDKIMEAFEKGNRKRIEEIALLFHNEPGRGAEVFLHLMGEAVLRGLDWKK